MIENVPSIYAQPSIYNQAGGGGGGGGGVKPLPDGYTKLMYAELTDDSNYVAVKLYENNEKNFSFFDTVSINIYLPELDKNYAGMNLNCWLISRSWYQGANYFGGACAMNWKAQGQNKVNIEFGAAVGGGYHTETFNDNNKVNFGMPQFVNITLGRDIETGRFYFILNGIRYNGKIMPVTSDWALNFTLMDTPYVPLYKGTRIFSFDVLDGADPNNVKMKVVPVKRNLDNVVGFFDLVAQKFYTAELNAYSAGPPVV